MKFSSFNFHLILLWNSYILSNAKIKVILAAYIAIDHWKNPYWLITMCGTIPVSPLLGCCPRSWQSWQNLWNSLLSPKYRAEQFLNDFCASGYILFCKLCQHNVLTKHVGMCKVHLWSKAHVMKKKNLQHTISNCVISVKGNKQNCDKLTWKKINLGKKERILKTTKIL